VSPDAVTDGVALLFSSKSDELFVIVLKSEDLFSTSSPPSNWSFPVFFVNSVAKNVRLLPPLMVSPGAVRPPPQWRYCLFSDYFTVWFRSTCSNFAFNISVFYRAAWNAILSVRPSVCLSVCQTRKLWQTKERSVQIFIRYEKPFTLFYWEKECLLGVTPFTWNFWLTGPRWSNIDDVEPIFARRASDVTPREKKFN